MQSIYNKQHILTSFLDQDTVYHVICISESWLSNNKLELLNIPGYKIAASYCRKLRSGGGVCILLLETMESVELKEISEMSVEYVMEVCAAELPKENYLFVVVYWNRREEVIFYSQLQKLLKYLNKKYCKYNIILGGDFNIDILKNNLNRNNFLNLMTENNFIQHVMKPTHITQTSSTCIDLIFTNFERKKVHTYVEELGFSDHAGTLIHVNAPLQNKKSTW